MRSISSSMLLSLFILLSYTSLVTSQDHCRRPKDCSLFPLYTCYATHKGLTCENASEFEGFEVTGRPFIVFDYYPYIQHNDTGEPCHTIPRSKDLESYVNYIESDSLNIADLDILGNCSQLSYCDSKTKTCQPKRNIGSSCQYNSQCIFGSEGFPAHCNLNESVCTIPRDLPIFAYNNMTVGKYWKAATVSVIATGALVICILVGRQQAGKLVSGVSGLIEKWQNRDDHHHYSSATDPMLSTSVATATDEGDVWQTSKKSWWHAIPGMKWLVLSLSQQNNRNENPATYVPLDNRPTQPPPYRD
ncbi:hypothetical protein BJ944DRAFT_267878 [Cunninghamella echinulata]|nr:hypothetical protein BJ944DRAFT_267878 [Cunninghamella echinulata]